MTSLVDSAAQFSSQLKEIGLAEEVVEALKNYGIKTLGQLAFVIGQPGQPIQDTAVEGVLRGALNRGPAIQETACLKRAAFEAQTFVTSTLRQAVERSDDAPKKIAAAERASRMQDLKNRLPGVSVEGELEPAHCVLEKACSMYDTNSLKCLGVASCISRGQEVQGASKNKELSWEKGSLILKNVDDQLACSTDSVTWSAERSRLALPN